jgi:hypothetical protein
MSYRLIFRQFFLPIFISIFASAIIIGIWPNDGTLDNFTTNYIGPLMGLDGEYAYDAALLEAWIEISFFLLVLHAGSRKFKYMLRSQQ